MHTYIYIYIYTHTHTCKRYSSRKGATEVSLCGSDTEVSLTGCEVSWGLPRETGPAKCATSPMHTTTHTQSAALAPYLMAAMIVRQSLSCQLIHALVVGM